MIRTVCLSALTLSIAMPALAKTVTVSGDWIRLGDVAPVVGDAAQKPIAAAPLAGERLPLAPEFIEMQARTAGFPVDMPDGEMIWVTRGHTTTVHQVNTTPAYSQPATTHTTASKLPDAEDGLVPVLTIDVRRGDPITADMIEMVPPDPKRRIQGLIHSPHHLVDTEATRTVRAGQPLTLRDIKAVSVIRKGDPIQLVYETGALRLTVDAKALGDAAKGESIRVMNLQSKRTMDATAFAPGEARVGVHGL